MPRIRSSARRTALAALLALPLLFSIGLLAATRAAAGEASLETAIRGSRILFVGSFEKLEASNLDLLPGSRDTALVRVREMIEEPDVLNLDRESLVTVVLDPANPLPVAGGQAVFLTDGYLYAENVAVSEVARISDRFDVDAIRKTVAEVRRKQADEALSARLASAAVVVDGAVAVVRPEKERDEVERGEHSAHWALAALEIGSILKGKGADGVYFAQDGDEFWADAPKLAAGDKGIFLLQPYDGDDLPAGSYVVVNRLDVQPTTELDRVRGLLR